MNEQLPQSEPLAPLFRTQRLQRLFGWLASPIFLPCFFSIFIVMHPFFWLGRFFGYRVFNSVFNVLNFLFVLSLRLVGTRVRVIGKENLPEKGPVLFVSNHQSIFDICIIAHFLARLHPKFIAKKELAKGVPSVSIALAHGGSVTIDRKNPAQALPAIENFGSYIEQNGFTAVIFPEGTRAKDGKLKKFKARGLETLRKKAPSAAIVPAAMSGSWQLLRDKLLPIPFGQEVRLTILPPLSPEEVAEKELSSLLENKIRQVVERAEPTKA